MKKLVLRLFPAVCMLVGVLVFLSLSATAANGDIVGDLYSTDIMAYVNGKPIVSYNIGGRTAIVLEDLKGVSWSGNNPGYGYGFDCWYHEETRTFTARAGGYGGVYGDPKVERGVGGGAVVGHIYETDIQAIFNEHYVPSYNIGGKTAICIEDVGTVTENSPNAAYGYSDYMCKFEWNDEERVIRLDTWQGQDPKDVPLHKLEFTLTDDVLTATFDQLNHYNNSGLYLNVSDAFLQDTYRIRPFYMDGEEVGTLWVNFSGTIKMNTDLDKIYEHTKDLCEVLSYDEAVDYITTDFTVIDRRDLESASVFLAEKDGDKYLFYALKKGGLILEWKSMGDYYDTIEIREDEEGMYLYVYPFAGPHGATGMRQSIDPERYE